MEMIRKAVSPAALELFKKLAPPDEQPMASKCEPIDDDAAKRIAAREKVLKVLAGGGRE